MNYGLINKPISPKDWIFKSYSPLLGGVLNPSGNWKNWLPISEYQNNYGFDRMACVTFSYLNCIEILWKFHFENERNFSDRFLAKASHTTHAGNSLEQVDQFARLRGLLSEIEYPDTANSWSEYYQELTDELLEKAKTFLTEYEINTEWVTPYKRLEVIEALKSSPLQVTVAWASGEGILSPTGEYNHAVTCFGYKENEYWDIFDHYTQTTKKYAWNYQFGAIKKFTLTKKSNNPTPMQVVNNTLYQLVEAPGGFALGLDGRLIIDDVAKILASFLVRNNGVIEGKVKPIRLVDWDSVNHVDLKGNSI